MTTQDQLEAVRKMRQFSKVQQRVLRSKGRINQTRLNEHHIVIDAKFESFAKKVDMTVEDFKTLYVINWNQ